MNVSNEQKIRFLQLLKEVILYNIDFPNDIEFENTLIILKRYYSILFNPLSN
jgi:hypothetical protein